MKMEAIAAANSRLEVTVMRQRMGFIISSIRDREHGEEWIFSEPSISEERNTGRTFDSQYAGGMEFIFPSDEKEQFAGRTYEDHGILWRMPYQIKENSDSITAEAASGEMGIRSDYEIRLIENQVEIRVTLSNISNKPIPYLSRLHPAFLLEEAAELELHIDKIIFEEAAAYCSFEPQKCQDECGRVGIREGEPLMLEVPATWKGHELFCHIRQTKGEFRITRNERSLRFQYEHDKLPYLTMCSFKKNEKRVGILEPANAPGISLGSIQQRAAIPVLHPGQTITYDFAILAE